MLQKQGAPTALEEVVETKEKLTRNEEKVRYNILTH